MHAIIGLGNPGDQYALTPHNIGFMVCDLLSLSFGFSFCFNSRIKGSVGSFMYKNNKVLVLKPQTYMNLSGESISLFVKFYKLELDKLIVIHDDVDMQIGRIKIKKNSSSGGHKGALSIINALGTKDFIRIKVGVGRNSCSTAHYVLSNFSDSELDTVKQAIERAKNAALDIVYNGLTHAMNSYNKKVTEDS